MVSGIRVLRMPCKKEFQNIILGKQGLQNTGDHGNLFTAKFVLINQMLLREKNI